MICEERCIVLDIDGTICPVKKKDESYMDLKPFPEMVNKIRKYKENGFYFIYYTARNMRTHNGNLGKINASTLKLLFNWFDKHEIPYDEIYVGKPWSGRGGFYVDDKTIRPNEFLEKSYEEIIEIIG